MALRRIMAGLAVLLVLGAGSVLAANVSLRNTLASVQHGLVAADSAGTTRSDPLPLFAVKLSIGGKTFFVKTLTWNLSTDAVETSSGVGPVQRSPGAQHFQEISLTTLPIGNVLDLLRLWAQDSKGTQNATLTLLDTSLKPTYTYTLTHPWIETIDQTTANSTATNPMTINFTLAFDSVTVTDPQGNAAAIPPGR